MPRIPRIVAGPESRPRAAPAAFGGGAGTAALGAALSDVGSAAAAIWDADQSARYHRAVGELASSGQEFIQGLEQDQDYATKEERYQKHLDQEKRRLRTGLSGRYAREFDDSAYQVGERMRLSVRDQVRKDGILSARGNLAETEAAARKAIENATDAGQRAIHVANLRAAYEAAATGGVISPEDKAHANEALDGFIEKQTFLREAQQHEDALVAGISDPRARLEAARKIDDAKLRDEVVARVGRRNQEDAYYEAKAKADKLDSFERVAASEFHKALTDPDYGPDDIPAFLPRTEQASLLAVIQSRAKNNPVPFDYAQFDRLHSMTPQELAQATIEPVREVTQPDGSTVRVSLLANEPAYRALIEKRGKARTSQVDVTTDGFDAALYKAASDYGIKDEERGKLRLRVMEELQAWSKANRGLPPDEITQQRVISQQAAKAVVNENTGWFDSAKHVYELTPQTEFDIGMVPSEHVYPITRLLEQSPLPITPDNIRTIYGAVSNGVPPASIPSILGALSKVGADVTPAAIQAAYERGAQVGMFPRAPVPAPAPAPVAAPVPPAPVVIGVPPSSTTRSAPEAPAPSPAPTPEPAPKARTAKEAEADALAYAQQPDAAKRAAAEAYAAQSRLSNLRRDARSRAAAKARAEDDLWATVEQKRRAAELEAIRRRRGGGR